VDAAYNRWAASYDSYDNPMVFMASEALAASVGDLAGVGAAFEFGCGTGRNLKLLQSRGVASLSGCDLSEGMLDVARQRCPGVPLFQHDMGQPLPLDKAATVDLALFCLTLEHVADLAAPLAQARRIVRPGLGRIAIFEIHPFMSLGGVGAHFEDDAGEVVEMPTVAHQFSDYLTIFAKLDLRLEECREWRPRDIGTPMPLKAMKRGPNFPIVVEFSLSSCLLDSA
jgi:malonyl-CoA O-methyltransferase